MDIISDNISNTKDREITATCVFDAPRDLVWKVWTESEHIIKWWGPNGFTNTINKMEVKPGGEWQFIMHGPDGRNYLNKIIYIEVEKPYRLVYDHISTPKFHVTVTFEEQDGKTKLTMQSLFSTAEERNRTIEVFNAVEGMNQTLERLKEYLPKM